MQDKCNSDTQQTQTNLDSEAHESQYDLIRDFKAVILAHQLIKLLCQRNMLTPNQPTMYFLHTMYVIKIAVT